MTQFKTVALPATTIVVKGKDMYTVETANKAIGPIGRAIEQEARGGWILHSYVVIPATVYRKKGIFEKLLGWIPVIGILFRSNKDDEYHPQYYSLIFTKED